MKNINLNPKSIKTAREKIQRLSKVQDKTFKKLLKNLDVSETSLVGEYLFDYLYNFGSLKELQKTYKKYKDFE